MTRKTKGLWHAQTSSNLLLPFSDDWIDKNNAEQMGIKHENQPITGLTADEAKQSAFEQKKPQRRKNNISAMHIFMKRKIMKRNVDDGKKFFFKWI